MKGSIYHDVAPYLALVPSVVAPLGVVPPIKEHANESPFFTSTREEYDIIRNPCKVSK